MNGHVDAGQTRLPGTERPGVKPSGTQKGKLGSPWLTLFGHHEPSDALLINGHVGDKDAG